MHVMQLYPGFELVILCFTLEEVKTWVLLHNCNLKASRTLPEFDSVFTELHETGTQSETCEYELT